MKLKNQFQNLSQLILTTIIMKRLIMMITTMMMNNTTPKVLLRNLIEKKMYQVAVDPLQILILQL